MLAEREATHGDFAETAAIAAELREVLTRAGTRRAERGQVPLTSAQAEAVFMTCAKLARIVAGDPGHPDHWADIAGYLVLAQGRPPGPPPVPSVTLRRLIDATVRRAEGFPPHQKRDAAGWALRLIGMVGKLCDLLEYGQQIRRSEIAAELAEIVCVAPILAQRIGIDLEAAIVETFDDVSQRLGFPEPLGEAGL
ncbi:MAG TPA: DUF6378 domain-containing protein [Stellaceae bacterium]|nr:DUF6378 domain-containing protein [Stellaceae bacterium]